MGFSSGQTWNQVQFSFHSKMEVYFPKIVLSQTVLSESVVPETVLLESAFSESVFSETVFFGGVPITSMIISTFSSFSS